MRLNLPAIAAVVVAVFAASAAGDDPYRFITWNATYGYMNPLGDRQPVILINGQFPGPDIYAVTNDNLIVNVHNSLNESFLISWY